MAHRMIVGHTRASLPLEAIQAVIHPWGGATISQDYCSGLSIYANAFTKGARYEALLPKWVKRFRVIFHHTMGATQSWYFTVYVSDYAQNCSNTGYSHYAGNITEMLITPWYNHPWGDARRINVRGRWSSDGGIGALHGVLVEYQRTQREEFT